MRLCMRLPKPNIVLLFLAGSLLASGKVFAGTFEEALARLPAVQVPHFRKDTFLISKFGAKADGVFINTTAINKAISACSEKGGGVVMIPQGLWLTGPLLMKSNVNLNLATGAVLQFTSDFDQYPLTEGNWEG